MAVPHVPTIVKHCTIAIYRDGRIAARTQKEKFIQCFQIARARLMQYGFIVLGGGDLKAPITLTPKGRSADLRHRGEGRAKSVLFDSLYVQADIDGKQAEALAAAREKMIQRIAELEGTSKSRFKKSTE